MHQEDMTVFDEIIGKSGRSSGSNGRNRKYKPRLLSCRAVLLTSISLVLTRQRKMPLNRSSSGCKSSLAVPSRPSYVI